MREGGRNNSLGNLMTSSEEQGMLQALRFFVGLPERSETMQKRGGSKRRTQPPKEVMEKLVGRRGRKQTDEKEEGGSE